MSGITMAPACASGAAGAYLQDYGSYDNSQSVKTVTCSFSVDSDGYVYGHISNTLTQHYQWLKAGAVGDYEVYASLYTGNCDAGTLDSWLSCSVDRVWSVSANYLADPIDSMTLDIQIRKAVGGAVQATCRITCSAESLW